MGELKLHAFFDPELIVPSASSIHMLEFWMRLQEWTEDPRPRLGPSTSLALQELMSQPPAVEGLPPAEFWKIVGKLVSRVEAYPDASETVCSNHIGDAYTPFWGHDQNIEKLIDALGYSPCEGGTAIATDSRCWASHIRRPKCELCQSRLIELYTRPLMSLEGMWRDLYLESASDSTDVLRAYSSEMFPSLTFADSAWNGVNLIRGEVHEVTRKLVHHLGVLNDQAREIWSTYPSTTDRQSHLASLSVEASPENANTHRSKSAMRARMFSFEGGEICCEWHTKLQRHRDRIYFAVEGGRVYVGAITDHL